MRKGWTRVFTRLAHFAAVKGLGRRIARHFPVEVVMPKTFCFWTFL